jgi:hypothetical protein
MLLALILACVASFGAFAEETTPNMEAGFFFNLFPMFEYTNRAAENTGISDRALGEYYAKPTFGAGGVYLNRGPITAIGIMEFQQDIWSKLYKRSFINLPDSETGWAPDLMGLGTFYPNVGFVDYDSGAFRFSIGRRKIKDGPGTYGLGISSYNPYYDHIAASMAVPIGSGKLGYDYVAVGMQRWWNDETTLGDGYQPKYFFMHRASWTGRRFTFGINEYNLISGTSPDFQDWGPFLFYHNLFNNHQNVMAGFDFNWTPTDTSAFYGQFIIDDFSLPGEGGNPNAMGAMVGAEIDLFKQARTAKAKYYDADYTYYVGRDQTAPGGLSARIEGYLLSRYLYRRSLSVVDEGFTAQYQVMTNWLGGRRDVVNPFLATPLAPDTALGRLTLNWTGSPLSGSFAFDYRLVGSESEKKDFGDWSLVDYDNWIISPSPSTELGFTLVGEYWLNSLTMATAGAKLTVAGGNAEVTLNAGFAHQFAAGKGPTLR